MKLRIVVLAFLILGFLSSCLSAQEESAKEPEYGWQKEMVGGANLTQTSFDNWAQGGENSLAWQFFLNFKFVNDQEKTNWANSGKFGYGSTKTGDEDQRKSIDEIKLESVFTYKLNLHVNPYAAVNGETQFAAGYNYDTEPKTQISAFMDPGYFRESVGLGYKPNDIVATRLGAAMKQTITSDYPVPYADDPDTDGIEKTKNEIGAELVTDVNWKISENSLFTSKLELFSTLEAFNETDLNWDNVFTTKISKYLNVNFNFRIFYDRDISKRRQIYQSVALGLSYSFL
ncbi:MAG: DUF3078 domain-containing protein [Candidatus Krumholzibacteriota bacterium]|nr:DUF3078 domain-containing protein [Candidatus Krumholzibacteriota bacterium]